MDEFSEKINQVLSDPEQMAKIMELAGKLGGDVPKEKPPAPEMPFQEEQIGRIMTMLSHCGSEDGLLKALRPYLPPEKAEKMSRAVRYAKLSKIISQVLQEQRTG